MIAKDQRGGDETAEIGCEFFRECRENKSYLSIDFGWLLLAKIMELDGWS